MFSHPSEADPDCETALDSIRVPKWPFWMADGILLAFAIMVFVRADGQPSHATLLMAVLAVSIGAVAFLTPYLFELLLRYRFLADRWDGMIIAATLEMRLKQLHAQVESLNKAHKVISGEIKSLTQTLHNNNEMLSARVQHLEQLQVQSNIATAEPPACEKPTEPTASETPTETAVAAEQPVAATPMQQASGKSPRPRPGLLDRAMEQGNGSGDTPAVKRIIGRTFSPHLVSPEVVTPKATKPKSNETHVLARVLIGVGNKPYIRGDLPGLSPDKGIAMDFREIGVWQWVSSEVVSPGKIRIFRNDQDPEQASFHNVEPGQSLEIQPKFPKLSEKI